MTRIEQAIEALERARQQLSPATTPNKLGDPVEGGIARISAALRILRSLPAEPSAELVEAAREAGLTLQATGQRLRNYNAHLDMAERCSDTARRLAAALPPEPVSLEEQVVAQAIYESMGRAMPPYETPSDWTEIGPDHDKARVIWMTVARSAIAALARHREGR